MFRWGLCGSRVICYCTRCSSYLLRGFFLFICFTPAVCLDLSLWCFCVIDKNVNFKADTASPAHSGKRRETVASHLNQTHWRRPLWLEIKFKAEWWVSFNHLLSAWCLMYTHRCVRVQRTWKAASALPIGYLPSVKKWKSPWDIC